MQNRIIVCGTRDFNDKPLLQKTLDSVLNGMQSVEIVSGGCRGADTYGEEYARSRKISVKRFPADWDKYGRAAGPIRNRQMLEYATAENATVIAFWDGKSKGTMNMIQTAQKQGANVHVINYQLI